MFENTIGPVPIIGIPQDTIKSIRALADGSEVKLSKSWVHSDYPDIAFVDLGENPILPDSVDFVLKVSVK